jgi:hypothetical protein
MAAREAIPGNVRCQHGPVTTEGRPPHNLASTLRYPVGHCHLLSSSPQHSCTGQEQLPWLPMKRKGRV